MNLNEGRPVRKLGRLVPDRGLIQDILDVGRELWPFGHPCRNCDELAMNHPVTGPPIDCEEWR